MSPRGTKGGGGDPLAELEAAVARGDLANVYVLYGDEPDAIRRAVATIRKAVIPPDDATAKSMEAFNYDRFDGPDVKAAKQVLDACVQVPMLSKYRLVELANPDELGKYRRGSDDDGPVSTRDAATNAIAEYVAKPCPSTVFVIYGSQIDGRAKLVKAAQKTGRVCKFTGLGHDSEGIAYVISEGKRLQVQIDRRAAAWLVECIGTSRSELTGAVERAKLYADRAKLTRDDFEAVVAHTREANIFHLTDAVGQGDARTALEVLAQLFATGEKDQGSAMRVFAMLTRQIRLIFAAKFHNQTRGLEGQKPFIVRKLQEQARGFDSHRLRAAYSGLARLDHDLKGGSRVAYASPYLALQRWILDTCGALHGVDPRR